MAAPTVLVTSNHPDKAITLLSKHARVTILAGGDPTTTNELLKKINGYDAVISLLTDQISSEIISSCPDLKLVANVAVGYDNIDVEAATKHGVLVTNTPGVLDKTTAELAFGLLLACARRIPEADRYVRNGEWGNWQSDLMLGVDVHEKTLGIVGFGRIGQSLAKLATGFDMKILYTCSQSAKVRSLSNGLNGRCKQASLDELLSMSHFISLNCPLNKDTYHLIGQKELSMVKPGCILINTSRGAVVDQGALIEALKVGRLASAGLDVFEDEPNVPQELRSMSQVVLTPHIGSASIETRLAMSMLAVEGLIAAFSGRVPPNAVNHEVWGTFAKRACDQIIEQG